MKLRGQAHSSVEYLPPPWLRSAAGYLPGLAATRTARGLTISELAVKTGISRETH